MRHRKAALRDVRLRRGRNLFLIGLSMYAAYGMMYSGVVSRWIDGANEYAMLGSFVAGMFFTSLFTLAPAIVALAELSQSTPWHLVVVPGALGSVVGDLLLFLFLRDVVITSVSEIISGPWHRRWKVLIRRPFLQWIIPATGLLLYTLPFVPDEVGLSLMGLSNLRITLLIPLTFAVNIVSISMIWFSVHAFFA
ncbi:MAG TPA: hypothetical protein VNM40_02330 [Candidatus Paceibacterota bacterium]|nr:hypothetical protein [Candidatus Paceibacterota bacterium]